MDDLVNTWLDQQDIIDLMSELQEVAYTGDTYSNRVLPISLPGTPVIPAANKYTEQSGKNNNFKKSPTADNAITNINTPNSIHHGFRNGKEVGNAKPGTNWSQSLSSLSSQNVGTHDASSSSLNSLNIDFTSTDSNNNTPRVSGSISNTDSDQNDNRSLTKTPTSLAKELDQIYLSTGNEPEEMLTLSDIIDSDFACAAKFIEMHLDNMPLNTDNTSDSHNINLYNNHTNRSLTDEMAMDELKSEPLTGGNFAGNLRRASVAWGGKKTTSTKNSPTSASKPKSNITANITTDSMADNIGLGFTGNAELRESFTTLAAFQRQQQLHALEEQQMCLEMCKPPQIDQPNSSSNTMFSIGSALDNERAKLNAMFGTMNEHQFWPPPPNPPPMTFDQSPCVLSQQTPTSSSQFIPSPSTGTLRGLHNHTAHKNTSTSFLPNLMPSFPSVDLHNALSPKDYSVLSSQFTSPLYSSSAMPIGPCINQSPMSATISTNHTSGIPTLTASRHNVNNWSPTHSKVIKDDVRMTSTPMKSSANERSYQKLKTLTNHIDREGGGSNKSQSEKEEESNDGKTRAVRMCDNCKCTKTTMWRRGNGNKSLCNACGTYFRTHGVARPVITEEEERNSAVRCGNCTTSVTSVWRSQPDGSKICNACALYQRVHKRPRPLTLKRNIKVFKRQRRSHGIQHTSKPSFVAHTHPQPTQPSFVNLFPRINNPMNAISADAWTNQQSSKY